jgi:hypothetical protein
MKIQKYLYEYHGTVTPPPGKKDEAPVLPYRQTFYVIAADEAGALDRLQADNPRVPDFVRTARPALHASKDW